MRPSNSEGCFLTMRFQLLYAQISDSCSTILTFSVRSGELGLGAQVLAKKIVRLLLSKRVSFMACFFCVSFSCQLSILQKPMISWCGVGSLCLIQFWTVTSLIQARV